MRVNKVIQAVDTHACGEPARVIVGGVADVPGATMYEKMVYLETQADELRQRMLREPRGSPASNCNLILPPTRPEADAGYVIMEQVEYAPMSGTNTIGVTTVLIETGMVEAKEPITELILESPAGLIPVRAEVDNGKVKNVTFENVPSFAVHLDATIEVPQLGTVTVDVAWGGMFFVIADAEQLGLQLSPDQAGEAVRVGEMIKAATQEQEHGAPAVEQSADDLGVCWQLHPSDLAPPQLNSDAPRMKRADGDAIAEFGQRQASAAERIVEVEVIQFADGVHHVHRHALARTIGDLVVESIGEVDRLEQNPHQDPKQEAKMRRHPRFVEQLLVAQPIVDGGF